MRPPTITIATVCLLQLPSPGGAEAQEEIRARLQLEPGGAEHEVRMEVHRVPVDPPTVSAEEAELEPEELVIGVELDGRPVAYPVRYLALSEVVNDRVGETPVAPSW